jgi:hypothetical protein
MTFTDTRAGWLAMGPEKVMEVIEIGLFNDLEGHTVGVVKSASWQCPARARAPLYSEPVPRAS